MKQLKVKQISALATLAKEDAKIELMKKEASQGVIDVVNWDEYPYRPEVKFYAAWAGSSFFLLFDVHENAIRAVNTTYHSPVYEDSCVEFFVQYPGKKTYRNFEFNSIGAALSAVRESRSSFQYLSPEIMDTIRIHTSLPKEPVVKETTSYWQLLVEIPLVLLDIPENDPTGKILRANFYKCGDKTPTPHFLSWNPIQVEQPDFHRPEYFGEIRFV